jgi:hypothetical protein
MGVRQGDEVVRVVAERAERAELVDVMHVDRRFALAVRECLARVAFAHRMPGEVRGAGLFPLSVVAALAGGGPAGVRRSALLAEVLVAPGAFPGREIRATGDRADAHRASSVMVAGAGLEPAISGI